MDPLIERAAKDLAAAGRVVALTGAGISVESGIPPFRGKGGLWEKYDPMEVATLEAFESDPEKVWRLLLKDMKELLDSAEPNDAHRGLARLEQMGRLKTVITQNVDGLHQKAGSRDVVEFHGTFARHRCTRCRDRRQAAQIDLDEIPPRCSCGGIYRPECIFFGELIPPESLLRSRAAAEGCDLMLVVGTSASVQPAAYMPVLAKRAGARIIEINAEPTPLTPNISDYLILGSAGEIFREVLRRMEAEAG